MAAVENTSGLSLGTGIEYSWTVLTLSESSGDQFSVTSSTSTLPLTPANNPLKCFWLSTY